MTHLPFIAACYALGVGVPVFFAVNAWLRLSKARNRLAALDTRS